MDRLGTFDAGYVGRLRVGPAQRIRNRQAVRETDRTEGYEQLTELCRLGEVAMAAALAERNSSWGWAVVDGQVQDR